MATKVMDDGERELHTLLSEVDPMAHSRLVQLEKDLASAGDEVPTAESVLVWLTPASLSERAEHRYGRTARVLEVVRNILTVLPLIVTWASLSAATYNFGYIASRQLVTVERSFLELWQANFDNQAPLAVPTFSEVAQFDVFLLTALVLCSVLLQIATQQAAKRGRRLSQLLEQRVSEILRAIDLRRAQREQRLLRGTLETALGDGAVALREMVADVREQRERLKELEAQKEREFASLAAVASGLRGSTETMVGHAAEMRALSEEFQRSSRLLAQAVGELAGLRTDLDGTLRDFIGRASSFAHALDRIIASHEAFHASLEELGTRLDERATRLDTRYEELNETSARRQEQLDALATSIAAQAERLREHLIELIGRVPSARDVAEEVAEAWARAQAAHLAELTAKLDRTLLALADRLRAEVAEPIVTSPLLTTGARRVEELQGAVARLDAIMAQVHRDALVLGAALRGLTGAVDGGIEISELPGGWLEAMPPPRRS